MEILKTPRKPLTIEQMDKTLKEMASRKAEHDALFIKTHFKPPFNEQSAPYFQRWTFCSWLGKNDEVILPQFFTYIKVKFLITKNMKIPIVIGNNNLPLQYLQKRQEWMKKRKWVFKFIKRSVANKLQYFVMIRVFKKNRVENFTEIILPSELINLNTVKLLLRPVRGAPSFLFISVFYNMQGESKHQSKHWMVDHELSNIFVVNSPHSNPVYSEFDKSALDDLIYSVWDDDTGDRRHTWLISYNTSEQLRLQATYLKKEEKEFEQKLKYYGIPIPQEKFFTKQCRFSYAQSLFLHKFFKLVYRYEFKRLMMFGVVSWSFRSSLVVDI